MVSAVRWLHSLVIDSTPSTGSSIRTTTHGVVKNRTAAIGSSFGPLASE